MKIIIETPGFKPTKSLNDFIINKVAKLDRLHKGIISAEITLEQDVKKTKELIRCTLILNIPGKDEYLKSNSPIFEDAILKVVENAQRRLRIRKTKRIERSKSVVKEKTK